MSQEKICFLSFEEARQLVAAIQEEEDIHRPNHRIFNVYNHDDKPICWFDYDEVVQDVGVTKQDEGSQAKVTEYILNRIPDWAVDI